MTPVISSAGKLPSHYLSNGKNRKAITCSAADKLGISPP